MENASSVNSVDLAGRDAAMLSAVEIGLGSLLHAFHIPLAGHFLSLNQAFILSRSVLKARVARQPIVVSNVSAVLKSLSPAGKKLTPMLAISAQGLLFGFGTLFFGANAFGVVVGSIISSVWAFIQPVLIYYLLFGKTLFFVGDYLFEKLHEAFAFNKEQLLMVLFGVFVIKVLASILVAVAALRMTSQQVEVYERRLVELGRLRQKKDSGRRASIFGEIFNPLFLVSLALTGMFFWFSEAGVSQMIWGLLRPVAVAVILFFGVRWIPFERMPNKYLQSAVQALRRADY